MLRFKILNINVFGDEYFDTFLNFVSETLAIGQYVFHRFNNININVSIFKTINNFFSIFHFDFSLFAVAGTLHFPISAMKTSIYLLVHVFQKQK